MSQITEERVSDIKFALEYTITNCRELSASGLTSMTATLSEIVGLEANSSSANVWAKISFALTDIRNRNLSEREAERSRAIRPPSTE